MAVNTTSNVSVTRNAASGVAGTLWTVDVTACNLSTDITVKDFKVLHNGVLVNNSNFTKNSSTMITYTGVALAVNTTVVVQRDTPITRVATLAYRDKLSVVNYEAELDRIHKVLNEYEINGAGATSIPTFGFPSDDAFSSAWNGDTVQTATRNALYDQMILYATLANPTFTGVVIVPDQADLSNNTRAANTKYADTRVANALASSPALGGSPTSATPAQTADNTTIATTAWVNDAAKPIVEANRNAAGTISFNNGIATAITYSSEIVDTAGAFNPATGVFTVPTGLGGRYLVNTGITINGLCNEMFIDMWINTGGGFAANRRVAHDRNPVGDTLNQLHGMAISPYLAPGHSLELCLTQTNSGAAARSTFAADIQTYIVLIRIPSDT